MPEIAMLWNSYMDLMQKAAENNSSTTKGDRETCFSCQAQVPTLQHWSGTARTSPSAELPGVRQDTPRGHGPFSTQTSAHPSARPQQLI